MTPLLYSILRVMSIDIVEFFSKTQDVVMRAIFANVRQNAQKGRKKHKMPLPSLLILYRIRNKNTSAILPNYIANFTLFPLHQENAHKKCRAQKTHKTKFLLTKCIREGKICIGHNPFVLYFGRSFK